MPNRHVIKETIAVYANAILDGAYADGGRERVVAIRNQMIEILGFMATTLIFAIRVMMRNLPQNSANRLSTMYLELMIQSLLDS